MALRVAAVVVLSTLAGCSNQPSTPETSKSTTPPATVAITTPSTKSQEDYPAKPSGFIVMDWSESNTCVVKAVDPSSGTVSRVATYTNIDCPVADDVSSAVTFSPDFQKMALSNARFHGKAGWMDMLGRVQFFGPPPSNPEFGRAPDVATVGFDRHGNFYYTVGDTKGITYYRVPAGSTAEGEPIGTVAEERDAVFGPLPGGILGLNAKVSFRDASSCIHSSSAYDPDQQIYYYGNDRGEIFKSPDWCPAHGDVILSGINDGPDQIVLSPNGQKLMFTKLGSDPNEPPQMKFYVLNLSGTASPVQIPVDPGLARESSYSWAVVRWL